MEVPEVSRQWLSTAFPNLPKVKWYKETTSGKESYEAKFKRNKKRYSVEFDTNGAVEDVERLTKWRALSNEVQASLGSTFDEMERFKLIKIQEQWTAATPRLLSEAILNNDRAAITLRFEVVFKANIEGEQAIWEGLFDANGQMLSKRKVILRPTDNLDL